MKDFMKFAEDINLQKYKLYTIFVQILNNLKQKQVSMKQQIA